MKKRKAFLSDICIWAVSIIYMLIIMGFDGHLFLVDDNRNQFYPVIKKSFDTLLSTGKFPLIDFFQMRGMLIGDEGYYGQTNILMFVAYLLEKITLPYIDLINIYILLCFSLGNVAWNFLLEKLGFDKKVRASIILMMSGVSAYVSLGYWYYVYNSYLILPLLLLSCYYIVAYKDEKKNYYFSALVLYLSLMLGNVQYTFYHYIIWGIIVFSYILLSRNWERIKYLLSNAIIAITISAPNLLVSISASKRRSLFVGDDFMQMPVAFWRQLLFSSIPVNWLGRLMGKNQFWKEKVIDGQFVFPDWIEHVFTGFLFWGFLFFVVYEIIAIAKKKFKFEKRFADIDVVRQYVICVCISAIFFELFQLGKGFGVADLMHLFPIVNSFRHLFKISLVLPGLFAIISAYILDKQSSKILWCFVIVTILLGFYNNYTICNAGYHRFYTEIDKSRAKQYFQLEDYKDEMIEKGIDLKNYRMVSVMEDSLENIAADERDVRKMSDNLKTLPGIYTAGGYENAVVIEGYNIVSAVYPAFYVDYARTANISKAIFMYYMQGTEEFENLFISQMIYNGIKYIVFDKDSESYVYFYELFDENDMINVSRVIEMSNDTVIVELDSVQRICEGASVTQNSNINSICMLVDEERVLNQIDSTFTYQNELIAFYENEGEMVSLTVAPNQFGDATILFDDAANDKIITLTYRDTFIENTLLIGLVLSFVCLGMLMVEISGVLNVCAKKHLD